MSHVLPVDRPNNYVNNRNLSEYDEAYRNDNANKTCSYITENPKQLAGRHSSFRVEIRGINNYTDLEF